MLKKTFRCAQGIADVSLWFVMRGASGALIDKSVEARNPAIEGGVRVVEHEDSACARVEALQQELERIAKINAACGTTATVFILTRNRQEKHLPEGLTPAVFDDLTERFVPRGLVVLHQSLHGSKGLGADYVVIAGLDAGTGGYPRDRVQEPLLELLLPAQKSQNEEERRLFYVGLTRAKREVTLED
ncbi:3'-5' exonuclease [Paraburkholderia sediminicola]|uniref:3'-5' exonuclease n=1 Tax=Paraburkholderia sediminicola TaxID=458836 RepID=UPI0038BB13CE